VTRRGAGAEPQERRDRDEERGHAGAAMNTRTGGAAAAILRSSSSSRNERDENAAATFASITGDAPMPVDAQLVRLAKEDRDAAFELLYNAYRGRIFTFLLRLARSSETADDLAQETFVKAYGALARCEPETKLLPWLYRIANNTAIDHFRRRTHFTWLPFIAIGGTAQEPRAIDEHGRVPERADIATVLATLPPENAAALLLHATEGYSYDEIAKIQGCTLAAVRSRIARARAAFKERWPGP
jgi:RNA polymerase sigma-70 factor (ECF subfamily)